MIGKISSVLHQTLRQLGLEGSTGLGQLPTVATGRLTGQTGAVASVATYTPTSDGSFEVVGNILVTTATTHDFTFNCTYTDEGGTSRTALMILFTVGASEIFAIVNSGGAVPYQGAPLRIRAKGGQAITVLTQGTFTSVVYNVEADIKQAS